jgi:hypothetical protein
MTRIVRSLIAATGIALCATPALAREYRDEGPGYRGEGPGYRGEERERRGEERREIRELEDVRDRFFARWNGSPWSRSRFDSWYARRRSEIRYRFAWLDGECWRY